MNEALQRIEEPAPESAVPAPIIKAPITPAQAKVEAIASLTMSAYSKASTLEISPEESAALQVDFPDEAFQPGAGGKESLIYIEHAYLRDRLNQVFGPGRWAIIPRNRWAEDFTFVNKYKETIQASRVYVEAMLCIRGCFVGESIGDMVYYKNNDSTNYGDAVEGAKTDSLRRCLKELGVGLQPWKKEFCEGWWFRQREKKKPKTPQFTGSNGASQPKPWEKLTPPERITQIQSAVKQWPSFFAVVLRNAGVLTEDQTLADLFPQHFADMSREQALDLVRKTKELATNPPPSEPETSEEPATSKEPSVQQQLSQLIVASGFTFDQWCGWAVESGQIDENCTSFDDVPEKTAALCLKASKTMLKSLLSLNPKNKEAK